MKKDAFSLEGKRAYVTGGAQGIGEAAARAFACFGADVAIVDVNADKAEQVAVDIAREYGVTTLSVACDVTKPDEVSHMVEKIVTAWGGLDIAFNNAGICMNEPAESMSYDAWSKVIDINLTGVFLTSQAAGKVMIAQKGGSIINTASMSAHIVNHPQPQVAYNASKAGVIQLTKSLAVEWAEHGVRVNSISPGYIKTSLTESGAFPPAWKERWLSLSVTKRLGLTSDLAPMLVYLASDAAPFTTGADFIIDGGFTCI